jgi:hypothetical protein
MSSMLVVMMLLRNHVGSKICASDPGTSRAHLNECKPAALLAGKESNGPLEFTGKRDTAKVVGGSFV